MSGTNNLQILTQPLFFRGGHAYGVGGKGTSHKIILILCYYPLIWVKYSYYYDKNAIYYCVVLYTAYTEYMLLLASRKYAQWSN